MYKKLSASEISQVISKIRRKYDEYTTKFFKTKKLKADFENRYINALRSQVDISNFLLAEISAIDELIKKEEKKIEEAQPYRPEEKKMNFADKILLENQEKIAKYPSVSFHKDANPEVKKLLGAMQKLYDEDFPKLFTCLRSLLTPAEDRELTEMENNLRYLGYIGNGMTSSKLSRYYNLLCRFPRDYKAVEWEEKQYILESAFLLHDLNDILQKMKSRKSFKNEADCKKFTVIVEYVGALIADFRLKDLKKQK